MTTCQSKKIFKQDSMTVKGDSCLGTCTSQAMSCSSGHTCPGACVRQKHKAAAARLPTGCPKWRHVCTGYHSNAQVADFEGRLQRPQDLLGDTCQWWGWAFYNEAEEEELQRTTTARLRLALKEGHQRNQALLGGHLG